MYIYIQQKTVPGVTGAPDTPLSAVLEIPAGQVVGVFYNDVNGSGIKSVTRPDSTLGDWFDDVTKVNFEQTYTMEFNQENKLVMRPPPPNSPAPSIEPNSVPNFQGGKKRRYHGKTKKSRR